MSQKTEKIVNEFYTKFIKELDELIIEATNLELHKDASGKTIQTSRKN
jgi:hypothetical protein